jgi:hypothetical protein
MIVTGFTRCRINTDVDMPVSPDYGDSMKEVYSDFGCVFVQDNRRLLILEGAGIGHPNPPKE